MRETGENIWECKYGVIHWSVYIIYRYTGKRKGIL